MRILVSGPVLGPGAFLEEQIDLPAMPRIGERLILVTDKERTNYRIRDVWWEPTQEPEAWVSVDLDRSRP